MNIMFDDTYHPGLSVFENELFIHVHHPDMLLSYDNNFLTFKRIPSLAAFKEAEDYLRNFHIKHNQQHLKFYFPQNDQIPEELLIYLTNDNYNIGFLELYAIDPKQFPIVVENPETKIQTVTWEHLETYLTFQYEQDLRFGQEYANQRMNHHKRNFDSDKIFQVLAFYNGVPAGSLDVIVSVNTAEIDGLFVLDFFQKKGIGSQLQKYVMEHFFDKTVILVANGHDTARDMYKRQNYQYQGFRYEVMKVFES